MLAGPFWLPAAGRAAPSCRPDELSRVSREFVLPQRHRIRSGADFSAVTRGPGGARAGSRLLVVHANQTDSRAVRPPRVGFVVSKGVGGAVVRNRVRRRLRALMAHRLAAVPAGVDVVVRAQPAAAAQQSTTLGAELDRLLGKALRGLVPGDGRGQLSVR